MNHSMYSKIYLLYCVPRKQRTSGGLAYNNAYGFCSFLGFCGALSIFLEANASLHKVTPAFPGSLFSTSLYHSQHSNPQACFFLFFYSSLVPFMLCGHDTEEFALRINNKKHCLVEVFRISWWKTYHNYFWMSILLETFL